MKKTNFQKTKYILIMSILMLGFNNCGQYSSSTLASNGVSGGNLSPSVFLGADSVIQLPTNSILISGTVSDSDGTIVNKKWTQVAGPSSAIFLNTSADSQNFSSLIQGTYVFRLEVTDDDGAKNHDDIQVVVLPVSSYDFTYYISPTGNDSTGTGSQANPWRTLYKATSTINTANTLIRLSAGTFVETQTSLLPVGVSLQGEGNSTVIRSTLNQLFTPIILAQSVEGTLGNQSISYLKLDGNNLTTSVGLVIAGRSNVTVHNTTIENFREVGVNFSGISGWTGATEPTIYSTGNSFRNNTVTNNSNYLTFYGTGNVQVGGQIGFLLHDNTITQPSRGQGGQGIGWPIKMANEGYVKGLKIYNNTVIKAPFTGAYGGDNGWNFAIEFWNLKGGIEIYNNTIQGTTDMCGVVKGSYAFGFKFHDNIVSQPSLNSSYEGGLMLEVDIYDTFVENNIFRNVASGIEFAPHDYNGNGVGINVHNVVVRNNLFENIGFLGGGQGQAIRWHNTDVNTVTYVSDINIDNNTAVAAPGADAAIVGFGLPGYPGASPTTRVNVRNNIIKGFSFFSIGSGIPSGLENLSISNNIMYLNGTNDDVFFGFGNPSPPSVNYVNSQNIKLNPLLTSDFHLQNGSPAIDSGLNVGIPFLGVAPDRGAFEKQ